MFNEMIYDTYHFLYINISKYIMIMIMTDYFNSIITDDLKQSVIKEYLDNQENLREQMVILEDYNNYIASYEYKKSLDIESVCEEIDVYTRARGNYFELILFHLQIFIETFNYKKYLYLKFNNNIKSDVYYSNEAGEINASNLVALVNDCELQTIFNSNYKSKETQEIFADLISKRIKDVFVIYNYYRKNIKHPYVYKSNIYNYLIKDMVYDYINTLDKYIQISPCEYDDIYLNNISINNNITTDKQVIEDINNNIYSIDFETFIDLSFIIKYYAQHFSRDGSKTLNTFYSNKMPSLVVPELYKVFLNNITPLDI